MIYRYIGHNDIIELKRNKRIAYIIKNVNTKDISEYINSLMAVLNSMGIDTNILNIPKIRKASNGNYMILLSVRAQLNQHHPSVIKLGHSLKSIDNFISIYELKGNL